MKKYVIAIAVFTILVIPFISSATTYYGDTDGDGVEDTVTSTSNTINVYHPKTGTNTTYNYSGRVFAIKGLSDTDGIAGKEIIVSWAIGTTQFGIDVIHDKTGQVSPYSLDGNYQIHSIDNDTDGIAGSEIIVIYTTIFGNSINFIHDKTGRVSAYSIPGDFAISNIKFLNTDNIAGAEILVSYASKLDKGISIIHDNTGVINSYTITGPKDTFTIYDKADTDGLAGDEIIITTDSTNTIEHKVKIIHDDTKTVNEYGVGVPFTIKGVSNYDSFAGSEICLMKTDSGMYYTIFDKSKTMQDSPGGCNVLPKHTITATAGTGGVIIPNGVITVGDSENQTFTIIPQTGWKILDVKVDGISKNNISSYVFSSVTANHTITASFLYQDPAITITPASDSFGSTLMGTTSQIHTYTVKNIGAAMPVSAPLVLGTVTVTGTNAADFAISTTSNNRCWMQTILKANESCKVEISFAPSATGARTANLSITSNDPLKPTSNVNLNGIGALPLLTVSKAGMGAGTITGSGTSCSTTCNSWHDIGTVVVLTAAADKDSTFTGWAGACNGTATCSVTMNANKSVTATFNKLPPVAGFSATPSQTTGKLLVNFKDKSERADSWLWNFGDGTTSTEQNPSHTYATRGKFTITLTATNVSGSNTVSRAIVNFIDITSIINLIFLDD